MPSDITGYLQGRALIRKVPSYYTSEQAWQYLDRVGWVEGDYSVEDIEAGRFPANLENLNIIIRRHYISFANDTTLMHLSESHYLDISPEATFKRLVADRAGGTYCYGHHTLMLGVLRALGYRTYPGIARMNFGFFVHGEPSYQAYAHMVLFVQLGEGQGTDPAHTWFADVAPGPPVPLGAIPLSDDPRNVVQNATPDEDNRLTRGFSPSSSLEPPSSSVYSPEQAKAVSESHALWQMEYRSPGKKDYQILYQFFEQEFTPIDYNVHHYAKMFKPHEDVFSDDVVLFRYVLADEGEEGAEKKKITERHLARLALFRGVLKKRIGEKVVLRIDCKSEKERLNLIREHFGIKVTEEDLVHIKGRTAAFENKQEITPEMDELL